MSTNRPATSFRFSEETREALARASLRYGISQVAVLELLVRMLDSGHLTIKHAARMEATKEVS